MATATVTFYANSGNLWITGDYTDIDEGIASFNDSDFISTNVAGDNCNMKLGPTPADFGTLTGVEFRFRSRHSTEVGDYRRLESLRLVETNGSTPISALALVSDTTSYATYSLTPAVVGANLSKADLDLARVIMIASAGTTGIAYISCFDVVYTYTVASSGFVPFPYPRGINGGFNWLKGGTQ